MLSGGCDCCSSYEVFCDLFRLFEWRDDPDKFDQLEKSLPKKKAHCGNCGHIGKRIHCYIVRLINIVKNVYSAITMISVILLLHTNPRGR